MEIKVLRLKNNEQPTYVGEKKQQHELNEKHEKQK